MKKIIIASLFAVSSSAFAMNFAPSNIQSDSNWAVAMVASRGACNISMDSLKGATGEITNVEGGVVYTVTLQGSVVAQAFATSTSAWAAKKCL